MTTASQTAARMLSVGSDVNWIRVDTDDVCLVDHPGRLGSVYCHSATRGQLMLLSNGNPLCSVAPALDAAHYTTSLYDGVYFKDLWFRGAGCMVGVAGGAEHVCVYISDTTPQFKHKNTWLATPLEARRIARFRAKHTSCTDHDVWVCFGPGGGIGATVRVRCAGCRKFRNVTDYGSW